jgi:hypothetical protein
MPLTQVDQAAEQLDTQVHRKVTAQVQQEYQDKATQAETQAVQAAVAVVVLVKPAPIAMVDQVVMVHRIQLAAQDKHMQAEAADLNQADQVEQVEVAPVTIQVVLKTMQHISVLAVEVAGITATPELEQDIKE